jgi:hypothetical protein
MVKSTLRPWILPVTVPESVPPRAVPLATGPVELKLMRAPLSCLSVKSPLKTYWLQAGARGSTGCACTGGETVRNPIVVIAVAAASNWALFTLVSCDIGSPFRLTINPRGSDLFGRWWGIGPADL